jgi:hypothetical protein
MLVAYVIVAVSVGAVVVWAIREIRWGRRVRRELHDRHVTRILDAAHREDGS